MGAFKKTGWVGALCYHGKRMDGSDGHLRQAGVDLHTHSTASDGWLSPAQLVHRAKEAGVKLLALTDHDTIDGLKEARKTACALEIRMVSGVELSTRWNRGVIHVVGLDFDPEGRRLANGLKQLCRLRALRATTIARKLEEVGITDALSWISKKGWATRITRAHFARFLVDKGHCRTIQQAFKRYLNPGKLAYADCDWAPIASALNWIKESGGCTVLAHPLRYGLDDGNLIQLLDEFKAGGGDAIEISSGAGSQREAVLCANYAQRFKLKGSIGSDYHGGIQNRSLLGRVLPFPASIEPIWGVFRNPGERR